MAVNMRCANSACGRVFHLDSTQGLKRIRCSTCNTVTLVPVGGTVAAKAADAAVGLPYHPARLKCTNCGAVLGVRDATCPQCGGDVRSGITVMRITEEEKRLFGLFRWGKKKRGKPVVPAAVLGVMLLLLAGVLAWCFVPADKWKSLLGLGQRAPMTGPALPEMQPDDQE